jgi:lambda family phage portal protein
MRSFLQRTAAAAAILAKGVTASVRFAGTAYRGAARDGAVLKWWKPRLASADRDYLPERANIVSRIRDLARNDTAVAAAKNRRVSSAVGAGWQLVADVDGAALGLDDAAVEALNTQIETQWRAYAAGHTFECDAQRQLTFGGLMRTVAASWFVDGEAFAHLPWSPGEPCATWSTRLDVIDNDRVSNPNNAQDTDLLRAGVELDPLTRAPIAYHVRSRNPADVGLESTTAIWTRVERWTPWGRPNFLHVFDRERPGQTRGISKLVSALSKLKSLQKFHEATIENAILNALMLGAIKSNAGPAAASKSFEDSKEGVASLTALEDARQQIYDGNTVDLGGGVQLPVLPLGDELQLFTQARDVGSFEAFVRTVLRAVASAAGITYEELNMDYSSTNYSSARAAMLISWSETLALQTLLRDQFAQPFYVAWLEEAVETARIELPGNAPDYWENLAAYTRCRWIAPGKGYIDATKEIQADAMAIENGFTTLADVCAAQGRNHRDVMRQRKRELDLMTQLGLAPPETGVTLAAASAPTVAAPDQNPAQPSAA